MRCFRRWFSVFFVLFFMGSSALTLRAQPAGADKEKPKPTDTKAVDPAAAPDAPKEPVKPEPPTTVEATATLTTEQIDSAIKQTADSTDLSEEEKATITKQWADAKSELTTEATERAEAAKSKQQLETFPAETARIKKEIEDAAQTPVPPFTLTLTPETTSKQLEQQLTAARTELADRQQKLTQLEDQLKTIKDEPTKLRDDLKKVQEDLDAVDKALAAPAPAGEKSRLTAARKARLEASKRAKRATITRIEQQLLTHDVRGPYLTVLRDQAARLVAPSDQKVKVMQEALTKLIKDETDLAAKQAEMARIEAINKDPQIRKLTETNADEAKQNAALADRKTALEKQVADAKKLVDRLREEFTDLEKKIKDRGIDRRLARDLTKRRRTLPNVRELSRSMVEMEQSVRDIEKMQETLSDRRRQLDSFDDRVKAIMAEVDSQIDAAKKTEIEAEIRKLLTTQKDLISKQLETYGSLFQQTRELEDVTQRTIEQSARFSKFIEENLLWIADADPINFSSFKEAGNALAWLISPSHWMDFLGTLRDQAINLAVPSVVVLLLFGALLIIRRRVATALVHIDSQLKRIDTDHFSLTPQAMILTLLLALPWPVLFLYVSIIVRSPWNASDFTRSSAAGIGVAAISYYMLRTLIHFLKPQGVAANHLRWTEQSISILRNNLIWLLLVLTPAAFIVASLMTYELDIYTDSLARLVYILFMVAIAVFLFRVLHPVKGAVAATIAANPNTLLARTRKIWILATLFMPLTPAVLASIGYFYTARQVGGQRLSLSMWLLFSILLLHGLLLRWLYVAQRKLSLQKAREKRDIRVAQPPAGSETPAEQGLVTMPDTALDLAQINEQTQQIVRALLAVTTVIGVYFIWSGVLPALRFLDEVNLWAHTTRPDGTPVYITLANVLLCILITFLAAVASKNVPGLLEITILKRTPLDAGGRYAFATITRYVISAVGIAAAFQAIGIGWSQVQWLVAAVSLGLGFGLQEIFANFVSGLIILFERPIRVGDTVTVGGVSGTVSRIRIRATTIVDWDRKELIVPNKEFITGQVMNWTLTDTITRVVVPVGVAYGSDLALAQRLLNEAVRNSPLILDEPAPMVAFVRLGESSLDFEVRAFVRTLADRGTTVHSLLETIDRKFREHNIEIPFPQRDLHLRTVSPGATLETKTAGSNGEGAPRGEGEKVG